MPDVIRLLPDHVANQIAAGEVVQRPASVVKELLENAIDAGATSIKLIIKDAGKSLIQVIDNGKGMSFTDARLAFERHATSKIRTSEDLFKLHTKGFRGEALAAIAAVSQVELSTKQENEELAVLLKIEGSSVVSQNHCVAPDGTSICVRNLFFNIPARRNFLKSDPIELRHIIDEFHRVAIVHHNIAFSFYNKSTEVLNLHSGTFKKRIVDIFGKNFNERLVPIEEQTSIANISGYVLKPEFSKKSRGEQFLFVNNRFVRNAYINFAVTSGFEGLIRDGYHPGYFLCLEIDPSEIDINIHPTKTEVKFEKDQAIYAVVRSSIKHKFGQFNITPSIDFKRDVNLDVPYKNLREMPPVPQIAFDRDFNPFLPTPKKAFALGSPAKASESWEALYVSVASKFNESLFDQQNTADPLLFEEKEVSKTFQLGKKYIVSRAHLNLVIIDQNRAHQRVLYEKYLANTTVKNTDTEPLIFPIKLELSKVETSILQGLKDSLLQIGFSLDVHDHFVLVTSIPHDMEESDAKATLESLVRSFSDDVPQDVAILADAVAKSLCKTLAVKNGQMLSESAQQTLTDALFECKEPLLSPFGEITHKIISINDLKTFF